MDELLQQLGDTVRQLRKDRGMSQARLAAKCGMNPPELSRIENGRKASNISTIYRLAKGLCVPAWRLLADSDTPIC